MEKSIAAFNDLAKATKATAEHAEDFKNVAQNSLGFGCRACHNSIFPTQKNALFFPGSNSKLKKVVKLLIEHVSKCTQVKKLQKTHQQIMSKANENDIDAIVNNIKKAYGIQNHAEIGTGVFATKEPHFLR